VRENFNTEKIRAVSTTRRFAIQSIEAATARSSIPPPTGQANETSLASSSDEPEANSDPKFPGLACSLMSENCSRIVYISRTGLVTRLDGPAAECLRPESNKIQRYFKNLLESGEGKVGSGLFSVVCGNRLFQQQDQGNLVGKEMPISIPDRSGDRF
jgi:hypothetical protein